MSSWLLPLLLLLAAPDAGPQFRDSALGFELGGKGVRALDERWVDALGGEPLLMRVERLSDSGAVVFYAVTRLSHADAGPTFEERLRVPAGVAPALDAVGAVSLGDRGVGVAVTLHEDLPDDGNSELIVIGAGPKLVFAGSHPCGPPADFALSTKGGVPQIEEVTSHKVLRFGNLDGGIEVEVGRRVEDYELRGDRFELTRDQYVDAFPPLPLRSVSAPELVDGKPESGTVLKRGVPVRLDVTPSEPNHGILMLRLVRSCPQKRGVAQQLHLDLGSDNTLDLDLGKPVVASHHVSVLGSGLFDMGPGGGEQELVILAAPVATDHVTVTLVRGDGPAGSACLAEVSAYGAPRSMP